MRNIHEGLGARFAAKDVARAASTAEDPGVTETRVKVGLEEMITGYEQEEVRILQAQGAGDVTIARILTDGQQRKESEMRDFVREHVGEVPELQARLDAVLMRQKRAEVTSDSEIEDFQEAA